MQDSIDAIVTDYLARNAGCDPCCGEDLDGFDIMPDLALAIRRAALCLTSRERRHPHQRRIPAAVLRQGERALSGCRGQIGAAQDFDELYRHVRSALSPIDGIGDLTVYDVSTRIGAFLKLAPAKVYLHAGAAEGAKAFGVRSKPSTPVDRSVFPSPMSHLSAGEIENFLCIYKRRLLKLLDLPALSAATG